MEKEESYIAEILILLVLVLLGIVIGVGGTKIYERHYLSSIELQFQRTAQADEFRAQCLNKLAAKWPGDRYYTIEDIDPNKNICRGYGVLLEDL